MSFVEPTRALPLRWGSYTERYLAGLALIVSGAIALQGSSATVGYPLAIGSLAHALGWWIMPTAGWRRIWVVLPSLLVTWVLLIGPAGVGLLAASFAAWLLVRQRPLLSYLFALPVLGAGILIRSVVWEFSDMIPALAVMGVVIAACAWGARGIHVLRVRHAADPQQDA